MSPSFQRFEKDMIGSKIGHVVGIYCSIEVTIQCPLKQVSYFFKSLEVEAQK